MSRKFKLIGQRKFIERFRIFTYKMIASLWERAMSKIENYVRRCGELTSK